MFIKKTAGMPSLYKWCYKIPFPQKEAAGKLKNMHKAYTKTLNPSTTEAYSSTVIHTTNGYFIVNNQHILIKTSEAKH